VNLGNLEAAVASYKQALKIKPDYVEVHNNLGTALFDLGQLDAALASFRRVLKIRPDYAEAHHNLANVLRDLGQSDAAAKSYRRVLKINPYHAEAYNNLGVIFKNSDRFDKAVASFERALEIRPDYFDALNNLGNAFRNLGQLDSAVASFERALEIKPDEAMAHHNLGMALRDIGQLDAAVASFERALVIKPDDAPAHHNLGHALRDTGQLDAAVASYQRALEIKPDYPAVYNDLSTLKTYTPDDAQINLLENLLSDSKADESDRMHLCFALAKVYDDTGEYDRSFDYLREANRLRKKELNYNIGDAERSFSRAREIYGSQAFDTALSDGHTAIQPVFIVGMPRSGTSLVEQILASHSNVYGGGELGVMDRLLMSLTLKLPEPVVGQNGRQPYQSEIDTLRNIYLEVLTSLNVPEKIVTDKTPHNFIWLGFIMAAFPTAKIINLNRDPRAVCWSMYKHYFTSESLGYAYDMEDLAQFYKLYIEQISYWREHLPNAIYDVCYEDLTENQETETRKLLEFCELDWEEHCLSFHKTKRVVKTASAAQVRQKMYKGSSEAWKKYEAQLQPLIKSLSSPTTAR